MRNPVHIALLALVLVPIQIVAPILACCMVPRSYQGVISQTAQEAVIFHHAGREELILRINYQITGDTLPDHFAWVVTVPNEPDSYAVADGKLFEEVFAWTEKVLRVPSRNKGSAPASGGIHVSPEVRVGPYVITPVKAVGARALEGLNQWLADNEFPAEEPSHMQYFVDQGFTFLCVRFDPNKGEASVAKDSAVPPLHLSFASESVYYPLRFSSRQGVFDVNLTVLTRKELDYARSFEDLAKINWKEDANFETNKSVLPDEFPKTLLEVFKKTRFKKLTGAWKLNRLNSRWVNRGGSIALWNTDVFLHTR